ncbi:ABC transporter ATP-binding protein [Yoonia maritima]|uniref:ABC transporter ATP-binding protein n=1 Tax=Yoonia maritima TaxID=1435347 RepID=UPI000D0E3BC8|nr:ABC transporter ATP-binding protein [Yoonia maritima]
MSLTTVDLSLGYDDQNVIEGLNLTFEKGQMVSILGPNGCGKSTLLKAMARLQKPSAGQVVLDSVDINTRDTRALAREMAILPQAPLAPEGISVADLVKRGRTPWRGFLSPWRDEDAKACHDALAAVQMQDLAERPINELSGGQRQRAWIALVLAQNAPLLLLDEPTTFLDLVHQIEVLSLLRKRNKETGLTVISVLHDLNLAARYSDQLVLLGHQRLVAAGTPDQVLTAANLSDAFGLKARVDPDPVTNTPMVIPL